MSGEEGKDRDELKDAILTVRKLHRKYLELTQDLYEFLVKLEYLDGDSFKK